MSAEVGGRRPLSGATATLRRLRWSDIPAAARMMATQYLHKPCARAWPWVMRVATWAGAIVFAVSLAAYKPLMRYWVDPADRRRQVTVAIIPKWATGIAVLRYAGDVQDWYRRLGLEIVVPGRGRMTGVIPPAN